MKKIQLMILLSISICGFGQSFQLSFTGSDALTSKNVEITSIIVTNLTKGCDTTLYGHDTILMLSPTGTHDTYANLKSFQLIQNYPNPFEDITNFGLQVSEKERIIIQLHSLLGQKIAEYDRIFDPGTHLFSCVATPGNFYILTATNGKTASSIKLISTSPSLSYSAHITHVAHSPIKEVFEKISPIDNFSFSIGDQLEYKGTASGYFQSIFLDAPEVSSDYTFSFEAPYIFDCGNSIIDERDGRTYETIEIESQCWLKTNINVGTMVEGIQDQQDNSNIEKYCYNNLPENCEIYGGQYQWNEMMQYDTNRATQGICPEGWRLPSDEEWNTLVNYIGGDTIAGQALIQGGDSGFEALLGGKRESDGSFTNIGSAAYFSSSLQFNDQDSYHRYLLNGDPGFYEDISSKSVGYSVRCIKGYPYRLHPMAIIIDTNVYQLLSDSIELAQGTYRYLELQQPQGSIEAGNIIIGLTGFGYIRKVVETSQSGNELTLNTEQAKLFDALESGELSFNMNLAADTSKNAISNAFTEYLADGVTVDDNSEGEWDFNFNNVTLYEDGPVKISIPSGNFNFNPNFKINWAYTLATGLEFFYVKVDTASYEASSKLQLALSENLTIKLFEKTIASRSKIFAIPMFPFIAVATLELKVKDEFSAGVTLTATTGYTQTKTLDFGYVYQNNQWAEIWNPQAVKDSVHPVEYNAIVNLTNKLSLIPEISIKLLNLVGPYFNIDLYTKYEAKMSVFPPNYWDMGINLGFTMEQVLDGTAIHDDLSHEVWKTPPIETSVWRFPDSVIYIKGNNQTGETDETLPDSLIVKVVDNFGYGWPEIPAVYTVTHGDGSVSDSIATTSDNGFARTKWTLGPEAGLNRVKTSVRKADLSDVKESPFTFNALATPPIHCPGIPTISYEGQTYHTVQIGDQCWLQENMNVGTMIIGGSQYPTDNDILEKYCYYNNPENCDIYGGLYEWSEMMQYSEEEGVQGICPDDWHLPTENEWQILEGTVDSLYPVGDPVWGMNGWRGYNAGHHLKSTTLWDYGNGDDAYNFKALPAGSLPINPVWTGLGGGAKFWTSTMIGPFYAKSRVLLSSENGVFRLNAAKGAGVSVRCLKD